MTEKMSALDQVGVRRLVSKIKDSMANAMESNVFGSARVSRLTLHEDLSRVVRQARVRARAEKIEEAQVIRDAVKNVADYWLRSAHMRWTDDTAVWYGVDWSSLNERNARCAMTFVDLDGNTHPQVSRKFTSRRRARVWTKSYVRHSVLANIKIQLAKPVEVIHLSMKLVPSDDRTFKEAALDHAQPEA